MISNRLRRLGMSLALLGLLGGCHSPVYWDGYSSVGYGSGGSRYGAGLSVTSTSLPHYSSTPVYSSVLGGYYGDYYRGYRPHPSYGGYKPGYRPSKPSGSKPNYRPSYRPNGPYRPGYRPESLRPGGLRPGGLRPGVGTRPRPSAKPSVVYPGSRPTLNPAPSQLQPMPSFRPSRARMR